MVQKKKKHPASRLLLCRQKCFVGERVFSYQNSVTHITTFHNCVEQKINSDFTIHRHPQPATVSFISDLMYKNMFKFNIKKKIEHLCIFLFSVVFKCMQN